MSDDPIARVEALCADMPYAQLLGAVPELMGDELTMRMDFRPHLIGNAAIQALHGGAIGAFLELTATAQLILTYPPEHLPRPIDVTVDYFGSGRSQTTFARARIVKPGKRIANVRVEAWQDSRERPIAALHGHFRLASLGQSAA